MTDDSDFETALDWIRELVDALDEAQAVIADVCDRPKYSQSLRNTVLAADAYLKEVSE
jgi:hypothetical protein